VSVSFHVHTRPKGECPAGAGQKISNYAYPLARTRGLCAMTKPDF
jgi:hypothetical protein